MWAFFVNKHLKLIINNMMYINKNTSNDVILELTSVSSLLSPNYLFKLTQDTDVSNITYFTGTDLSTFKCRYNRFEVIETGTTYVNLTASTVNLRSGSYRYDVYESTASTLSVSATTGTIISTGKAIVNGIDNEIPLVYR